MADPKFDFSDPDARSFCPQCGGAFALSAGSCHLCNVSLIDRATAQSIGVQAQVQAERTRAAEAADAPVVIHEAGDAVEAGGIAAHLEAAGIQFVSRRKGEQDPFRSHGPIEFLVWPRDVEAARELLADVGDLTEEEWEQMYGAGEAPEGLVDEPPSDGDRNPR